MQGPELDAEKPRFLLIFGEFLRKIEDGSRLRTPPARVTICSLVEPAHILAKQRNSEFMAKRRGNPNWGKPEPIGPVVPTVTSFEQVVKEYKLTPDQYIRSTRLREWARRNKNSKYIPEALLEAWGFEIESSL
jgi:hypothetical protein